MARKYRVEFRLGMPSIGSWDGKWSGSGRNYTVARELSLEDLERLGITAEGTSHWTHSWDDGWAASITARRLAPGERRKKSDGFCGYKWMVDRIVRWGDTRCRCEWERDPNSGRPGWEGEWIRCKWCHTSKMTDEARVALELTKKDKGE
jgi:hypothetical protein